MKGCGLLHEPFSRSDLLRVLERERVRETPTGPDPSPSGWPLCKRVLNRPCERLFNWAAWRWQSALHLWVDLYPVTKSRRGTSCTWTLIPLGRWEIYLYTFFNIRNCCCWKPFFFCVMFLKFVWMTVDLKLWHVDCCPVLWKFTKLQNTRVLFQCYLFIYLNFQSRCYFNSVIIYI